MMVVVVVVLSSTSVFGYHSFPSKFDKVWHRNEIAEMCEGLGLRIGVEVGVQRGLYAKEVLKNWPSFEKYVLVDLWHQQKNYLDKANVDEDRQESNYQATKKNLRKWEGKTIFYRNSSLEAAMDFAEESVDFVYLDARHDYCGVAEDIAAWYPKIKVGGFMG